MTLVREVEEGGGSRWGDENGYGNTHRGCTTRNNNNPRELERNRLDEQDIGIDPKTRAKGGSYHG